MPFFFVHLLRFTTHHCALSISLSLTLSLFLSVFFSFSLSMALYLSLSLLSISFSHAPFLFHFSFVVHYILHFHDLRSLSSLIVHRLVHNHALSSVTSLLRMHIIRTYTHDIEKKRRNSTRDHPIVRSWCIEVRLRRKKTFTDGSTTRNAKSKCELN